MMAAAEYSSNFVVVDWNINMSDPKLPTQSCEEAVVEEELRRLHLPQETENAVVERSSK